MEFSRVLFRSEVVGADCQRIHVVHVEALLGPGIAVVSRPEDPATLPELGEGSREDVAVLGDGQGRDVGGGEAVVDELPVVPLVDRPENAGAAAGSAGEEVAGRIDRSEERRVGQECRSRWWPY